MVTFKLSVFLFIVSSTMALPLRPDNGHAAHGPNTVLTPTATAESMRFVKRLIHDWSPIMNNPANGVGDGWGR
ncbi:hypothetical protein P691DRAFT_801875 [Macrolepiota fuliginosa MF-IS2]|uniref:Uncharacterized protein n=1 Tax=Macrolepiota fuliginosa MF-IS2 TaxID=1400762 RepID=A0A9P5XDW4_9AGAR|nr:hypothetical protein P691DRAFT_801875 [Macrolepiota fuliginosa MF-IS2]